jgi:hypothetical protein
MPEEKKNVVYLFGAGASNAVIKYFDPSNEGILMPDVAYSVLSACETTDDYSLKELCDIPAYVDKEQYRNADIERIITLYESSGTKKDIWRTNKLRNLFRLTINRTIQKASGMNNGSPDLITALIDLHSLSDYNEQLSAILTINYDNFIEKALLRNYEGINIPFEVIPVDNQYKINNSLPPLCKLHGSFNWENTNPVKIDDNLLTADEDEDRILWIPPGVIKKSDYYPFNAIWGTARLYLNCDILRIVGCSLNTNDWGLISLLHTTNRLRQDNGTKYEIQFINYPKTYQEIRDRFPYLTMRSVTNLPGFLQYIQSEYSLDYSEEKGDNPVEKIETWLETENVFELWLKAIAYNLLDKGTDIQKTDKGFFQKFYLGQDI